MLYCVETIKTTSLSEALGMSVNKKQIFLNGAKMGIPIGLGYFTVSFSLGISAKNAGLTAFQAAFAGLLLNASAGEYALFTLISAGAGYIEVAVMELIANARYLLMSCALSQKLSPEAKLPHRLIIGVAVTDEMFGASIARPEKVSPLYYFGMMAVAMPCWSVGTALGVAVGSVLPALAVSALSVSLYSMFLAVIVPAARENSIVLGVILISFAASFASTVLPVVSEIPEGTVIIILTVVISTLAALLFPIKDAEDSTDA